MLDDKTNLLKNNEVVTKTLENAKTSYMLKTGYLRENQGQTFSLRLWMDEDTPTSEEFMNKLFESKVVVLASYIVDEMPPEVFATTTNELNSITVDASDSFDEESGIEAYFFRLDEESWNESIEPVYTFSDLEYKEYTIEIQAEDFLGNRSEVKSLKEYPKVKATDYVNSLNGNGEVLNDGTVDNNLRYVGATPNNYVTFNSELWRIIGSMNNIKTTENGVGETRLKIIRAESIGSYSWDSSASNVNSGYGVSEWSQADAMKLMNPGYENETVGGSLYWNGQKGACYNGANQATVVCDFSESGLKDAAKSMIEEVLWNTGSNGTKASFNHIITDKFYELERSTNTSKICTSGIYCNDTILRTTIWKGYVGLMYPSDYGFATKGGTTTNRASCLSTVLYLWNQANVSDCKNNDWLYNSSTAQWTLSPTAGSAGSYVVFDVGPRGAVYDAGAYGDSLSLLPVVYLKDNVNIVSGTGELNHPFVVSLS